MGITCIAAPEPASLEATLPGFKTSPTAETAQPELGEHLVSLPWISMLKRLGLVRDSHAPGNDSDVP